MYLCVKHAAAHEILNIFDEDRYETEGYVIAVIDTSRLSDVTFHQDEDFDYGVWTTQKIPASAIVEWYEDPNPGDVDEDESNAYWGLGESESELRG